jgi:hypothetical protein
MHDLRLLPLAALLLAVPPGLSAQTQQAANVPLPDIRQLIKEVHEHQKQLEKVQENYTYSASFTTQELDSNGQVKKTETEECEEFFVNGHQVWRTVKKNGKTLDGQELEKENERVTKAVEKAQKPSPDEPKEDEQISLRRILEVSDVRNPRRESFRGRPTIVFDVVGQKDLKAHGLSEDLSKKLKGTVWIDEADRQVTRLEAAIDDNFRVGGGLVANVQKGSHFTFDQAPINGELWLPADAEISLQMRLLLFKGIHQHITVRDYDYKRFKVDAEQGKDAKAIVETKQ